jgi:hypothetical protein
VVDLKTVSHGWWDEQPSDRQRYQVTAGALATGREEAGVLVLSRQDGGFRLHPVDVEQSADDLLGWLADVHEPEDTERDFRGPGIDRECEWCPFRAECWPDQPDAEPQAVLVQTDDAREMALAEYDSARERVSRAESDMAFWRATLTGSQGGSYGPWALSWSRGTSSRLDVAAAREMLVEAGLPVPVKISRSTRIHVGKV